MFLQKGIFVPSPHLLDVTAKTQNKVTTEPLFWLSYQLLIPCTQLGKHFPLTLDHLPKFKFWNSPAEVNIITLFLYKTWNQRNWSSQSLKWVESLIRLLPGPEVRFQGQVLWTRDHTAHQHPCLDEKGTSSYTKTMSSLFWRKIVLSINSL